MRTVQEDMHTHLFFVEWQLLQMSCTISCSDWQCCCFTLPVCLCPSTSCSTCQHFTQLQPLRCPATLPRTLHYTPTSSRPALHLCWVTQGGAVLGGGVSVTTCNEICPEHFTVAAVVYCRKSSDVGSVQTNPAAGNKDWKVVQGKEMSVSFCCCCRI